uniref:Uncharacterized protein n=1 Tax=Octactis speculum TaxID=3111310 RepID=A0A7S2BSY6_9STRA
MTAIFFAYLVVSTLGTELSYFADLSPTIKRYWSKLSKKRDGGNPACMELSKLPQGDEFEKRGSPLPLELSPNALEEREFSTTKEHEVEEKQFDIESSPLPKYNKIEKRESSPPQESSSNTLEKRELSVTKEREDEEKKHLDIESFPFPEEKKIRKA